MLLIFMQYMYLHGPQERPIPLYRGFVWTVGLFQSVSWSFLGTGIELRFVCYTFFCWLPHSLDVIQWDLVLSCTWFSHCQSNFPWPLTKDRTMHWVYYQMSGARKSLRNSEYMVTAVPSTGRRLGVPTSSGSHYSVLRLWIVCCLWDSWGVLRRKWMQNQSNTLQQT